MDSSSDNTFYRANILYSVAIGYQMNGDFSGARDAYRRGIKECPGEFIVSIGKFMLNEISPQVYMDWAVKSSRGKMGIEADRSFDIAEWYLMHGDKASARNWYRKVVERANVNAGLFEILAARRLEKM
jgi:hypothetical protein